MLNLSHKKLDAWIYAIQLIVLIKNLAITFPNDEKFALSSQIKRATLSISNNIAEGSSRKTNAEKRRFYEIARSSLVEVDNCVEVALTLKYAERNNITDVEKTIEKIFKTLTGLINKNTLSNGQ